MLWLTHRDTWFGCQLILHFWLDIYIKSEKQRALVTRELTQILLAKSTSLLDFMFMVIALEIPLLKQKVITTGTVDNLCRELRTMKWLNWRLSVCYIYSAWRHSLLIMYLKGKFSLWKASERGLTLDTHALSFPSEEMGWKNETFQ